MVPHHGNHNQVTQQYAVGPEPFRDGPDPVGGHHADGGVGVHGGNGLTAALEHEQALGSRVGERHAVREGAVRGCARHPAATAAGADGHDTGRQRVFEMIAGGVAAGQGQLDQTLRAQVERGRVDQLRLGGPAASHGDDHRWRAARRQEPGEVGRHRGLARALARADHRHRRLGRDPRAGRRVEAEVGTLVGHTVAAGRPSPGSCARAGRRRAGPRGRAPARVRTAPSPRPWRPRGWRRRRAERRRRSCRRARASRDRRGGRRR